MLWKLTAPVLTKKHIKGIFLLSVFSKQRTQGQWWWSHLPDVLQQMCKELAWLQDSSCQLLHLPELTGRVDAETAESKMEVVFFQKCFKCNL